MSDEPRFELGKPALPELLGKNYILAQPKRRRFSKADVDRHSNNGYGAMYPAVNVKVYSGLSDVVQAVMDKWPGTPDKVAEKAVEFAWESACESFWEYWGDMTGSMENGLGKTSPEYLYFPGYPQAEVYSVGRSGGWLIVQGLPPVEDWDAIMLGWWYKFQRDILKDVEYQKSAEKLLEDIEANKWYLPHSSRYNYCTVKGGKDICLAEARADILAIAEKKYDGAAPALVNLGGGI